MGYIKYAPNANKAALISYVLGKTFLETVKIMMHELEVSNNAEHKKLAKSKKKLQLQMHNQFHQLFKNANSFLTDKEIEKFQESVNNLIDALW